MHRSYLSPIVISAVETRVRTPGGYVNVHGGLDPFQIVWEYRKVYGNDMVDQIWMEQRLTGKWHRNYA